MKKLNWAEMPSTWCTNGKLKELTWGKNDTAASIGALKIYILLCLLGSKQKLQGKDKIISDLSYDEIGEGTGLSRAVIARSIKKLQEHGLIVCMGNARQRKYEVVKTKPNGGWCKLPCKPIFGEGLKIKPFYQLHNRYQIELDALRLYLYLLSIRDNDEPYTKVSLAKVIEKTGIQLHEVPNAAALLHTIGLLSHSETTGFLFKSANFEQQSELYVFFFSYGEFLLRKPMPLKEIEKSIQLNDVQDYF